MPNQEQQHEPLAFLGAAFKGAEIGWTTFEKEAFAIFQTFEKLDYLLMDSKPAHVFTDHRNLLFISAPLSLEPALGRHIVSKVQRWALFLSRFPYIIEHVDGDLNVFADILTRWTKGYRRETKSLKTIHSLVEQSAQIVPSADEIVWPDQEDIRSSQERSSNKPLEALLNPETNMFDKQGCIWIPDDDLELQMKILVVSHCGSIGHRGISGTKAF